MHEYIRDNVYTYSIMQKVRVKLNEKKRAYDLEKYYLQVVNKRFGTLTNNFYVMVI